MVRVVVVAQLHLAVLAALVICCVSGVCAAKDHSTPPIETIPKGEDKIIPLSKGAKAPFAGQLFSVDTAIRWGNWLTQYRYRLELDVGRERELRLIEVKMQTSLLTIEKERASKVEESLSSRLFSSEERRVELEEQVLNPPWFRSIELGVVLGVVGTVGVLSLSIWALEARR